MGVLELTARGREVMEGAALTHIAMHVADLDATQGFYERYCGLNPIHERGEGDDRVVWLAEAGRETELILVLIGGGETHPQSETDFSHLGFALDSRAAVDDIAAVARADGCLAWEPRQDSYPAGYYCGLRDPAGRIVEFSYGQPLGPGAEDAEPPAEG